MCLPARFKDSIASYPRWHIPVRGVCGLLRSGPGDPRNARLWHKAAQPNAAGMSAAGGSGNAGVEEGFGFCEGFRMPAALDGAANSGGAAGVRKPPKDETARWAGRPGRAGPRAQLWGFKQRACRVGGKATRRLMLSLNVAQPLGALRGSFADRAMKIDALI